MTDNQILSTLKQEGLKSYNYVMSRGSKWRNRNVPIYIRKHLMFAYYTTEQNDIKCIHVLALPDSENPKVHFKTHILNY